MNGLLILKLSAHNFEESWLDLTVVLPWINYLISKRRNTALWYTCLCSLFQSWVIVIDKELQMFLEGNGCPETASQEESCAETASQEESCAETARQEATNVLRLWMPGGMWRFLFCFFNISLIRKGRIAQILGKPERGMAGAIQGAILWSRGLIIGCKMQCKAIRKAIYPKRS